LGRVLLPFDADLGRAGVALLGRGTVVALESEASADELSQDVGRGSSLSNKRLKGKPEKRSFDPDLRICPKSYLKANIRSRNRA